MINVNNKSKKDRCLFVIDENSSQTKYSTNDNFKKLAFFGEIYENYTEAAEFTPDNKYLFIAGYKGILKQIVFMNKSLKYFVIKEYHTVKNSDINCIKITPDGKHLFASGDRNILQHYVFDQDKTLLDISNTISGNNKRPITKLTVTQDSKWLFAATNKSDVTMYKITENTIESARVFERILKGFLADIVCTKNSLVIGDRDGNIKIAPLEKLKFQDFDDDRAIGFFKQLDYGFQSIYKILVVNYTKHDFVYIFTEEEQVNTKKNYNIQVFSDKNNDLKWCAIIENSGNCEAIFSKDKKYLFVTEKQKDCVILKKYNVKRKMLIKTKIEQKFKYPILIMEN